jgi:hypothetical protein
VSVEFPAGFWFIQEIRLHHGLLGYAVACGVPTKGDSVATL